MMLLDMMPDILNGFSRPGVIEEVCLEQQPFHPDERKMVVFKNQMLHIEK